MRCIGGRYDGHEGIWEPGFEGEEHFPDVLFIGACDVPGCPCGGESLAASTLPDGERDESRYLLHGCEQAVDGWLTGLYRDIEVCDVGISKQELLLDLAGVA